METTTQTCLRWLDALEQLALQEDAQLRAGDFAGAQASRERAEPLVRSLAAPAWPADEAIQQRIETVLAIRQRTHEWLIAELGTTTNALGRMDLAQRRLSRIAPAYRGTGVVAPNLSARG